MFDRGVPSICYGLRGLVYFQIDLRGTKSRPALRLFRRRRRQSGIRAREHPRADEGSRRPHQDPRLLRRCAGPLTGRGARAVEAAALQREAIREGARRASAVRRERLQHARTRLGAADLRGQRPAVRLYRRRRQDRDSCRRDGEGQHAARARSASRQDRAAVRGVREEGRAEDRRGQPSRGCTAASRG